MSSPAAGLCLVEPAAFGFNVQTARTNRFQQASADLTAAESARVARGEFAGLVTALRQAGVPLAIAADTLHPVKPDAVFPNNWVSFHEDGTVVLYPMHDPVRRAERREDIIQQVKQQLGYVEQRRLDLTAEEDAGRYLEGTGSLVLDRRERIAYACRSPRTSETLVREWADAMGYEAFIFDATTGDGVPVYHTNVVLWIGSRVVGAGLDWVPAAQRDALAERLGTSGRDILRLTDTQLHAFAGNMLEVGSPSGRHLVMSARAGASLDEQQRAQLLDAGCEPLVAPVPVIERLGGGSVRCMLAEVPLTAGTP